MSVLVFKELIAPCKFSVAFDKKANVELLILLILEEKFNIEVDNVFPIVVVVPEYDMSVVLVFKELIAPCKFSVAFDKKANVELLILLILEEKFNIEVDNVFPIVVVVPEYDMSVVFVFKFETDVFNDETDEFKFVTDVFRSLPTFDKY